MIFIEGKSISLRFVLVVRFLADAADLLAAENLTLISDFLLLRASSLRCGAPRCGKPRCPHEDSPPSCFESSMRLVCASCPHEDSNPDHNLFVVVSARSYSIQLNYKGVMMRE